jgi:hypothetical protein
MAYIGNQPTTAAFITDQFNGNGSTVAFTMSVSPANAASVLIVISGVVQDPSTYSVSGTTLTFSQAPPLGTANISARYLGVPATGIATTAYRTVTDFTATASQTTFPVPSYTAGYIDVYRNGARLGAADYTATNGTTVVLANAATVGDLVTTESFYVSSVLNAIPAAAGQVGAVYLANGAASQTFLDVANLNGTGAFLTPSGNTAQRPSSPIVGMQRWNTTTSSMEIYIGNNNWQTIASTAYSVDYLIAAGGGGGGGNNSGAGGGAGGLITSSGLSVSPGTSYTVTIGAGGTSTPTNGTNSSFGGQTAVGGGLGASNSGGPTSPGSGGSGGGANYNGGGGGLGTAGQGNNGGSAVTGATNYPGSGGGGAGAVGSNASGSVAGAGGIGLASTISGSSVYYAGGGGGSTQSGGTGGAGGLGGGGAGSPATSSNNGESGTVNTGGGGGAGGYGRSGVNVTGTNGAGGSGVVIIRYLGTAARATGGTITITGGYVIHTFTSSGTYIA